MKKTKLSEFTAAIRKVLERQCKSDEAYHALCAEKTQLRKLMERHELAKLNTLAGSATLYDQTRTLWAGKKLVKLLTPAQLRQVRHIAKYPCLVVRGVAKVQK